VEDIELQEIYMKTSNNITISVEKSLEELRISHELFEERVGEAEALLHRGGYKCSICGEYNFHFKTCLSHNTYE